MPKINSLSPIAAGFLTLCFGFSAQTQAEELPFPMLPATFENSSNKGIKGCVGFELDSKGNVDMHKTNLKIAGIGYNEGTNIIGSHGLIQTAKDGAHSFQMMYSKKNDYAYILANKAQKELCIVEKMTDLSFKKQGQHQSIMHTSEKEYTSSECSFTQHYTDLCRSFKKVVAPLKLKGFVIDWQGINTDGHIITSLSGNEKSYILTTNTLTGATVLTGIGEEKFSFTKDLKN